MTATGVHLEGVTKSFGAVDVIGGVDMQIGKGEFAVFVGPSGCGKSTLLRMIAGLEDTTSGSIHIGARDVTHEDPAKREVAMVFQSYALYPHLSVFENMAFSLRLARRPRKEVEEKVNRAAGILQLTDHLHKKPAQLSGGQRQRVAIGRAIVRAPEVFLFDEPLSNLDAELRVQMRLELARLHKALGTTMIYVTHDQVEAMTLADKIFVLKSGMVQQAGAPLDLYDDPVNRFVAGFIGSPGMNFLEATVSAHDTDGIRARPKGQPDLDLSVPITSRPAIDSAISLGMRPEHLTLTDGPGLQVTVDVAEELGGISYQYGALQDGSPVIFQQVGARHGLRGTVQNLLPEPGRIFAFDAGGQRVR
ncbi:sn-glycerol-3-phosphate ABC transporter ATP-binding protein UgpC [Paracoccus caeni]|uniref:Sn-glycerol-3-phosphate ABC transporter ATP-binding protein UgpC n=1 Tax=Paracoccus caeni TaxID=657651 RepID=A0A934SFZ9_9RHOB|nr:sn-glycerol-3-phosphate ABC transporter ATP-binding protein UgpC [Paracoccus caeni]MBK4216714.1 sn-glycerol-3-phosphate ABC transporter ATP-binding protein UgpC [Paracoccus caeni]